MLTIILNIRCISQKNITVDKLREIINLLDLNKIKSIEIIDSKTKTDTKLMQLYNGIREGKLVNDNDAKEHLYSNSSNNNAYYKLKHTLRERLLNTIFFIDAKTSKNSDIHNAHLNIQKITSLVQILLTKGLKQNAIYMAKKGLKISKIYEFTEERLILARILRFHDAIMSGNEIAFQKYDAIVNKSTDLLRSEVKVEGLFFQILILYVNDKSTKPYVYDTTTKYLEELAGYKPMEPSANWIYHYTMVSVAKYMSINDYAETLTICDNALEKIRSLPFKHTKSIVNISSQAITCCIQLKLYKKGEKNIMIGLEIIESGMFNWFKYKELYLTLCFHTCHYSKAWEIFNEVIFHKKFKNLPAGVREVWKIYEAWLYFFIKAGKITPNQEIKTKKFRITRYGNDVPIFFKDKRGLNVPILISQIALLLQQEKYDIVIDRMDAIAKYKDRYLDKAHNFRSNVFIRMLLTIPKADFKQKLVTKKAAKHRLMLDEISLDLANQSADIEILPYEDIWEVLLEQLK